MQEKTIHITILLINSMLFSSIYIYNQPIDFHCDSATFYNYGSSIAKNFWKLGLILALCILSFSIIFVLLKGFIKSKIKIISIIFLIIFSIFFIIISKNSISTPFDIFALDRPPVYPLVLFFSGTFFFDTFYIFIFLQAILSLFTIYFFYIIFIYLTGNKKYAFFVTFLYGMTSIPYILIKFISAEQLMYFLVILTFFSVISFHKRRKFFFLYIGLVSSILCWLTKWEGQLVFISFIIYFFLNYIFSKNKKKYFKPTITIISVTLIILSTWTVTRSILTKDFSTVLNVSNSTMDQSMWRFYSSLPSSITIYEKAFNIEKKSTGKFKSEIYPGQPDGTIIVHNRNGKHSKRLFNLIFQILEENPNSYKKLKKPLNDAYKSDRQNHIDFYYELFGKFKNNNEITENIMYQPNVFYFNFWDPKLTSKIGRNSKDKLYKKVIRESLINNPAIILSFLNNMFTAYGVDFDNYILYKNNPYSNLNDVDFLMPYNAGKCAENNLTPKKFTEYKNSYESYNNNYLFQKTIEFNDYINDTIRNYLGIIILISCFVLVFYDFKLFLPLVFIPMSLSFAVSVLVDSPTNSKYEVIIFSSNYILLGYFLFLISNKIFKLVKK